MSDTPRTDARWAEEWELWRNNTKADPAHGMCDFAASLERELSQVEKDAARLRTFAVLVKRGLAGGYIKAAVMLPDDPEAETLELVTLEQLADQAIAVDAALQSEKGKE